MTPQAPPRAASRDMCATSLTVVLSGFLALP